MRIRAIKLTRTKFIIIVVVLLISILSVIAAVLISTPSPTSGYTTTIISTNTTSTIMTSSTTIPIVNTTTNAVTSSSATTLTHTSTNESSTTARSSNKTSSHTTVSTSITTITTNSSVTTTTTSNQTSVTTSSRSNTTTSTRSSNSSVVSSSTKNTTTTTTTTRTSSVPSPQPPLSIHLSTEGDPSVTVSVVWKTGGTTNSSVVEYGTSAEYSSQAMGSAYTYPGSAGVLHRVRMYGLTPGTTYHYRVGDPVGGWSADHTFRTAPVDGRNFTFTAIADQGTTKYSVKNVEMASTLNSSFNLIAGDLSYSTGSQGTWDKWFNIIEPMASNALYLPSIGNHEIDANVGGNLSLYLNQFVLPGNEQWYSFNWGNAHFVSLYVSPYAEGTAPQYAWLAQDLEAASKNPRINWIIVYLHFPPYSSGRYANLLSLRSNLTPILDLYHVDVVLTGHDHNYQRTYPIYNGTQTSNAFDRYVDPKGTIYAVTGGGGESLYQFSQPAPTWSAQRAAVYEFVKISIEGNRLHYQAIKTEDGMVLDEFYITKSVS
ncbi:MAG: purple acid phosphatase [Thaumarchaeota archaeon]|nr:purple acid phosphatase [Nitrososphaerota archaeon]MCL5316645.1 purple acid phosphatase [Nitrososphaerota archaeon]